MKTELEKQLIEEVNRFKEIGYYAKNLLNEQEAPIEEPPADEELPTDELGTDISPVDDMSAELPAEDDVDAEIPMDDLGMDDTEEIDITDLVNMTKSIKRDLEDRGQDQTTGKMDDMFNKLNDLEGKLSQMDLIISKIDQLGVEVDLSIDRERVWFAVTVSLSGALDVAPEEAVAVFVTDPASISA